MFDEPGSIPDIFRVIARVQTSICSDHMDLHADTGEVVDVSVPASNTTMEIMSNTWTLETAYIPRGGYNSFRELLVEAIHRSLYRLPFRQQNAHADRIYVAAVMSNPWMAISPAINTHRRDAELERVFEALPIPHRIVYLITLADLCESWSDGWKFYHYTDITPSMVSAVSGGYSYSTQHCGDTIRLTDLTKHVPEFAIPLVHAVFGVDGFAANRATVDELHGMWLDLLSSRTMSSKGRQILVNAIVTSYPEFVVRPFLAKLKATKKIRLRNELITIIERRAEEARKTRVFIEDSIFNYDDSYSYP